MTCDFVVGAPRGAPSSERLCAGVEDEGEVVGDFGTLGLDGVQSRLEAGGPLRKVGLTTARRVSEFHWEWAHLFGVRVG